MISCYLEVAKTGVWSPEHCPQDRVGCGLRYASHLGRRLEDVSSKYKSHSLVIALFYLPLKKNFLALS